MEISFKSSFIADFLNAELNFNDIVEITNVASLSSAKKNSLSFYVNSSHKSDLLSTRAGLVILKRSDSDLRDGPSLYVSDPYLSFAKVSKLFLNSKKKKIIHETVICGSGNFSDDIFIGPYTVIGNNCHIGQNSYLESFVSIGDNVKIGNNVKIHSNVTIESDVVIGNNCEIFSGAIIGSDGFGYAIDENSSWIKIPQIGSVIVGNNVDIGSNTTIDRGSLDNTVIEDGVKIDNQVQIGHNCRIGKNTIIAGCAGIAGSTIIGKNCMIGGASMIKGHINISDNTTISGGSTIAKSINDPGKRFTSVFPYNLEHKEWLNIVKRLKKIGKKND